MSIEDLQEQFRAFKEETDRKLAALQNENDTLKASLDGVLSKIAPVNGTSTLPRPNTASRAKTPSKPSARPGSSDPARRNSIGNGPRGGLKPSASKEAVGDSGSVDNVVKGKAPGTIGKRSAALKEQKIEIDEKRIGSSQVGKRKVFYVTPADYVKSSEEDQPPAEDLKLEYIFGFNGKAARNNLFYTNKDQGATSLLYCVAATGVTYDIPSDSQKFFNGHNEDILCLAIHPNRPIAATGQLDPKGSGKPFTCVWDYSTMQQLARIENFHDRGVCAVAFSRDGKQLISVGNDDSHTAAVWDWESDVKKPVASGMIAKDEVYGIAVNPHNEKLEFAAFGSKLLKHFVLAPSESKSNNAPAFTIKGTILSSFKNTKVVQSAFHSALFTKGGDLVVGTTTGSVYMFKNNTYSKSIDSHKGKVGALVELPEGFASAGDDAVLTLYGADGSVTGTLELGKYKARSMDYANVNGGKFIIGTSNNHIIEMSVEEKKFNIVSEGHSNELWGLATHPTEPVFVTCSNDKTLRTWDLTTKKPIPNKFLVFKEEAICTAFSPDGKTVAVGHLSGKVTLVDWDSFTVKYEKKHRQEQIAAIAFSPNGQLLAVGSWDQMAELIDLESKSSVTLKGHTSSVTHLTFSEDSKFLVTNSRDYEILFWNTETGKRVDKAVTADVKWFEWSCILGFPVKGIFGKDQDGTDNNAAHVSYGQKLVVTGNDTGEVALFRYPASSKAIKKFVGHSAHVTNVKFTRDDKHVISTGGNDTGIFLWRVGSE